MNKMQRREIELLVKNCKANDIPLKLAKDLLKTSKKLSYENQSQSARLKEYEDLIYFHSKNAD